MPVSSGHPHQHASQQAHTRHGQLAWLRWDGQARGFEWHDLFDCAEWIDNSQDLDDDTPACQLFAGHPGQHDVR